MVSKKKVEREKSLTKISTWNLMGRLIKLNEQELIFLDAKERGIHIMSLQETGLKEHREILGKNGKIINLAGITDQYRGMAFYASGEWSERIISVKLVNDRIAVIRLDLGNQGQLAIINVYGPTGVVTRQNPEKGREFYDQVQQIFVSEKRKSSLVFIMGDFNSKRLLAQNRPHWRKAVAKVVEAVHLTWKRKELERLAKKHQNGEQAMAMATQEPQTEAERPVIRRQTTLMEHFART